MYDIRDLLKKCPKCGLIWMRVEGCEGETSCGGRPQIFDFEDSKFMLRYHFKRDGINLVSVPTKK